MFSGFNMVNKQLIRGSDCPHFSKFPACRTPVRLLCPDFRAAPNNGEVSILRLPMETSHRLPRLPLGAGFIVDLWGGLGEVYGMFLGGKSPIPQEARASLRCAHAESNPSDTRGVKCPPPARAIQYHSRA
jgi:hypothetical protein